MARRQRIDDEPFERFGICAGCQSVEDVKLFRVAPSRYRCERCANPDGRLRGSIRVVIDIAASDGGQVGINITSESFNPQDVPEIVGGAWVGLCNAINAYMRARGATDYDCMKRKVTQ